MLVSPGNVLAVGPGEECFAQGGGGGLGGLDRDADCLQGPQFREAPFGLGLVVAALGQLDVLSPEVGNPPTIGLSEIRLSRSSHSQLLSRTNHGERGEVPWHGRRGEFAKEFAKPASC